MPSFLSGRAAWSGRADRTVTRHLDQVPIRSRRPTRPPIWGDRRRRPRPTGPSNDTHRGQFDGRSDPSRNAVNHLHCSTEARPEGRAGGVPGTDVEIGGVSPVLEPDRGNPTSKARARPGIDRAVPSAAWLCAAGVSVRAGLKEALDALWSRTKVKRRKAFLGWASWPLAAMPDSCRWSRGRSGDVITTKSQRFTPGDLLGSGRGRPVGRRT